MKGRILTRDVMQMTKIDETTQRIIDGYRKRVETLEAQLKAAGEESAKLRARIGALEVQLAKAKGK